MHGLMPSQFNNIRFFVEYVIVYGPPPPPYACFCSILGNLFNADYTIRRYQAMVDNYQLFLSVSCSCNSFLLATRKPVLLVTN